jgi:hypothetical protein
MIVTGGTNDRTLRPRYFIAGQFNGTTHAALTAGQSLDLLLALNEIGKQEKAEQRLAAVIDRGCTVLIDSGCFNLANAHATKHGMNVIEALSLPPDRLEGFDALLARYIDVLGRIGDRVWGYVEVDIGGRDNKIKTRAKLEAAGLRPIPVYHPFSDGWDYFDYLAERYDRICLANLGTASEAVRKRLIATAAERKRKYPHLWIHALGATPNPSMLAFPLDSCDSSSWLASQRFGALQTWAATQRLWPADRGYYFDTSRGPDSDRGSRRSFTLLGYDAHMLGRAMRAVLDDQAAALGLITPETAHARCAPPAFAGQPVIQPPPVANRADGDGKRGRGMRRRSAGRAANSA